MEIMLTQGQVAIVDESDFDWLNQWKWYARWCSKGKTFYAQRNVKNANNEPRVLQMHRLILGLEFGDKRFGDHRNLITLDNRRENLRIATPSENRANSRTSCASGMKGAYWRKDLNKWQGQIRFGGKSLSLGVFPTAEDAHAAYQIAARKNFGEFARYDRRTDQREPQQDDR